MHNGFTQMPNTLLNDTTLNTADKLVAWVLQAYTRPGKDEVFPSQQTVAKLAGITPKTVRASMRRLQERAYISTASVVKGRVIRMRVHLDDGRPRGRGSVIQTDAQVIETEVPREKRPTKNIKSRISIEEYAAPPPIIEIDEPYWYESAKPDDVSNGLPELIEDGDDGPIYLCAPEEPDCLWDGWFELNLTRDASPKSTEVHGDDLVSSPTTPDEWSPMARAIHYLGLPMVTPDSDTMLYEVETVGLGLPGGSLLSSAKCDELIKRYGLERAWTHARYLPTRIENYPEHVARPTAFYIRSVENNAPPLRPLLEAQKIEKYACAVMAEHLTLPDVPDSVRQAVSAEVVRRIVAHGPDGPMVEYGPDYAVEV